MNKMDLMTRLDKNDVREFFSRNWMTHDAMWYGACVQELGPEKANEINKTAVRLMAGIEIQRVVKLMGGRADAPLTDFHELAEIIETTFGLVKAGFMNFDFRFPEKNLLQGRFNECFAHSGVSKYGLIDSYECGIVVRIKGWLEGLGVSYVMEPEFTGCLMHQHGECEIRFRFNLD
jgi:hypothetical protein